MSGQKKMSRGKALTIREDRARAEGVVIGRGEIIKLIERGAAAAFIATDDQKAKELRDLAADLRAKIEMLAGKIARDWRPMELPGP